MKKIMLVVTTLAFCASSFGGTPKPSEVTNQQEAAAETSPANAAQAAPRSALATSACSFTFSFGTNNTALQYCVTANGNIAQLATPFAREHIAVGTIGEGYAVCDITTNVGYYDYADFGDSGNWEPATVVSQSARSVKIARSTSDGVWTLTQTISRVEETPSVKVSMTLKNNTATDRLASLMRYADVDVSGTSNNNFDATANSAFGWNSSGSGSPPFGLMIQNVGNTVGLTTIPFVQKYRRRTDTLRSRHTFRFRTNHGHGWVRRDVLRGHGTEEQIKNSYSELQRYVKGACATNTYRPARAGFFCSKKQ
jgi:hypothetical protein